MDQRKDLQQNMPRPIAVSSGGIATPMTATGNMNFLRPAITSLNTGAAKPCCNTICQKRTLAGDSWLSAKLPKADIRFGYSITSSARCSQLGWSLRSRLFRRLASLTGDEKVI